MPEAVIWENGEARPAGPNAGEFQPLTLPELAAKASATGGPIGAALVAQHRRARQAGFGTHICDVEVDPETGQVQVIRYTAVQDVGRAIHPSYVEGQIQGGVAQGIGWALNEECIYDANGQLDNPSFLDYRMPVASDLPMIEPVIDRGAERQASAGHTRRRRSVHRAGAGGGCQCHPQRDGAAPDRPADVAAESAGGADGRELASRKVCWRRPPE